MGKACGLEQFLSRLVNHVARFVPNSVLGSRGLQPESGLHDITFKIHPGKLTPCSHLSKVLQPPQTAPPSGGLVLDTIGAVGLGVWIEAHGKNF